MGGVPESRGRAIIPHVLAVAAALGGCGGGTAGGRSGRGDGAAHCMPRAPRDGFAYPAGPYGTDVGQRFEAFALDDCDGVEVDFAGVLARAELVLFSVGAGWCPPCIEETEVLESGIYGAYCTRGLAVVQVLYQDEESRPATKLFCRAWRDRFGLTFPVLVDPLFVTERYFAGGKTPLNLLVDRDAVIRYRATGTAAPDLPQRIDQLLPP